MSIQKHITDLIHFYVKTNYEEYLKDSNSKTIDENKIEDVIQELYDDRKKHIQTFIIDSLKILYKDKKEEYPGDSTVTNILLNIFQDDELCKKRLKCEIQLHQQKIRGEKNDYNHIFR